MERSVAAWKQFFFLFVNLDLAHSTLIWRVNPPGNPKGKGLNLQKLRHVIIFKTRGARVLILNMAESTKRPKAESQLDVKQVGFIRFFKDIVSTQRCHLNSQALSDMMPIVAWHLPLNRRVKFIFLKRIF